ncbi:MAG: glycosyltransferase family 39 protein, partial [Planctomycetota bacterium]|nr:glycosyltransferase family 39 protein [Planctomycetota bacterium]
MVSNSAERANWIEEHGPVVAALLFFVAGLVWLGSSAHFHGDERYYTDSALRMLELGDPWTPRWADGSVRANKPLLTYWFVLAGFASIGVSFFAARLPFLVAGALLVWLTGHITKKLFPKERLAPLLAALIVACDYEVVTLARRSTPDILLMLFTAASLFGLARLVVVKERSTAAAAWFWLGGGLAIATKGGLGVLVLAFGIVVILATRAGTPLRRFFPPAVCAIALAVALVGLAPSLMTATRAGAPSFVDDQVGARLAGSIGEVARQLVDYATSLAKHFLPWIVFVVVGVFAARNAARERWRAHRSAIGLAIGWAALLLIVFSLSNTHRGRYLAPTHALLAVVIAPFLLDAARTGWARRAAFVSGIVVVCVATCAAVIVMRVDWVAGVGLLSPLVFYGVGVRLGRDEVRPFRALALALLASLTVAYEGVLALVDPSPLERVVEGVASGGSVGERSFPGCATLGLRDTVAGRLRVLSGGELNPRSFLSSAMDAEIGEVGCVIAEEGQWERLRALGFEVEVLSRGAVNLDVRSAVEVFLRGGEFDRYV